MAEFGDGDLADLAGIVPDADPALEDAGPAVDASDIGEGDPAPRLRRLGEQGRNHARRSPAQRQEGDAHGVEPGQVGIGGQAAVEDQFGRQHPGPCTPGLDETQNLVVLPVLAHAGVGIGEDPGVGIAGEEGENALLAPAALRDIVLLDERVIAVIGDGMEVEIEGPPAAKVDPEAADGGLPALHHGRTAARVHPA